MPIGFDKAIGMQQDALRVYQRRHQILASNLANADTPGYKARDIDFRAALAEQSGPGAPGMQATHARHFGGGGDLPGGEAQYRVPNQPSLDGNTVDPDLEMSAWAENVLRYQAALQFTSSRISSLKSAITGQQR
ncbi:flagellar basal body rod protein FlgB [Natronospira bacteriovora]|uniref:Flagellar basal body rod protein FlgB n=1 Tax=Natronospira bacteriovora TaxID=3069753 RepID=A0ABU0W3A7_9GAMM|nr:flagellar basal body rod protein FlgB [Natronospira sp. AB-CW4]MDQ2068495.1 flagellar basal body rod protein FlgB [Natronospira sp. AB-CW4]